MEKCPATIICAGRRSAVRWVKPRCRHTFVSSARDSWSIWRKRRIVDRSQDPAILSISSSPSLIRTAHQHDSPEAVLDARLQPLPLLSFEVHPKPHRRSLHQSHPDLAQFLHPRLDRWTELWRIHGPLIRSLQQLCRVLRRHRPVQIQSLVVIRLVLRNVLDRKSVV